MLGSEATLVGFFRRSNERCPKAFGKRIKMKKISVLTVLCVQQETLLFVVNVSAEISRGKEAHVCRKEGWGVRSIGEADNGNLRKPQQNNSNKTTISSTCCVI
ncbi:unnamed protein product [Ascophyllum nodosum]